MFFYLEKKISNGLAGIHQQLDIVPLSLLSEKERQTRLARVLKSCL